MALLCISQATRGEAKLCVIFNNGRPQFCAGNLFTQPSSSQSAGNKKAGNKKARSWSDHINCRHRTVV